MLLKRFNICSIPLLLATAMLLSMISLIVVAQDDFSGFPEPQSDFQSHIKAVEEYLLAKQMSQRKPSDVQFNLPFEYKANNSVPYRGKYFLIHGLNDSPYVFSDVANELVNRGFDVRAILMPGHGSTPKAQLNISAKDWYEHARQQLQLWQEDASVPMYLGGFSMGAVIATSLALENDHIAGLLLFSPAYKSRMNHLLRWSGIYSRFKPWVFGGMIIEDNPTKYNSIPINGAAQYYKLSKTLRKALSRKSLNMPVLMVASEDDSVVDTDYLLKSFANKFNSKRKQLILYTSNKALDEQAVVKQIENVNRRLAVYPEHRILSQSHHGVLIDSDNELYGKNGSVLVCNGNDWPTFSACLYSNEDHWFGAQHTPSPDQVPVARTTFNPDFGGVFKAFDEVFD